MNKISLKTKHFSLDARDITDRYKEVLKDELKDSVIFTMTNLTYQAIEFHIGCFLPDGTHTYDEQILTPQSHVTIDYSFYAHPISGLALRKCIPDKITTGAILVTIFHEDK